MLKLPDTEQSLWREASPGAVYPQLAENIKVDVVVVGAGIAGLSAAYLLKQAGLTVAVLEKATVGSGTTGHTTGKLTSQHNLIYNNLQEQFGSETARVYGEANQAAVELAGEIVQKEAIDCGWRWDDNYIFTNQPDSVDVLKKEAAAAARAGLPASFITDVPLPFATRGAVKFMRQAKIDAQKYLLGLARAVDGGGSRVYEQSGAIGIRDGTPARVQTKKATVTAKDTVVATKVPTFPLVARGGYALLEYPTESFAVAGWLEREVSGMYISPDEHHYSILPAEHGGKRVIVIVGAGGNIPGLASNRQARYQRLADYAEERFNVTELTHRWSGMDYFAYDQLPLIGKVYPWSKHLYTATGFRKWGLSNGTVAGMILRDLITEKNNPWAATFHSLRARSVAAIPRAAAEHLR